MSTILSGSFLSDGTAFNIPLESGYKKFELINLTDIGSTSAATPVMRATGTSLMLPGQAYVSTKTTNVATLDLENTIVANGFTFFDYANLPTFPVIAVTAVTAATPAQVTAAAHGLAVGDSVRLTLLNGTMGSMNGLLYTVNSVVDPNNFTITFDASAAAAGQVGNTPATAGFMQKVISSYFSPHNVVIGPTSTTAGNLGHLLLRMNTVPSVSQNPSQYSPFQRPYQIGAILRFYVPPASMAFVGFNLPQTANFIQCQIVNIAGPYTIKNELELQILTTGNQPGTITTATGLPPIIYPSGGASYASSFPFVTDIAETSGILSEAEDNTAFRGITVGTGVQTTAKTYQWIAYQSIN